MRKLIHTDNLLRLSVLALIGGLIYVLIEVTWRGYSHPSMLVVGGVCFVLIGEINERAYEWNMSLLFQGIIGAVMVTCVELFSGLILNVLLGLGVWDYSSLPMNLMGQVCLYYFLLWIPLAMVAVVLDDVLRYLLFGEPRPCYYLLPGQNCRVGRITERTAEVFRQNASGRTNI